MMNRSLALPIALLGLVLSACSTTYIPNTDVEDTSDNRKIVLFCEEYRHAVEDKNIGQILKMTSPRYDMDYDAFKQYLTNQFMKTTSIRYEIRYRRVALTETKHVLVDYTYAASYKIPGVKGEEWKHTVADNRLDLVLDGESFKIIAGM
jgi:hypothetical protein